METNEIKKALYKEKPMANKASNSSIYQYYDCKLQSGLTVMFKVPLSECTQFGDTEPAQLLIRWMI